MRRAVARNIFEISFTLSALPIFFFTRLLLLSNWFICGDLLGVVLGNSVDIFNREKTGSLCQIGRGLRTTANSFEPLRRGPLKEKA